MSHLLIVSDRSHLCRCIGSKRLYMVASIAFLSHHPVNTRPYRPCSLPRACSVYYYHFRLFHVLHRLFTFLYLSPDRSTIPHNMWILFQATFAIHFCLLNVDSRRFASLNRRQSFLHPLDAVWVDSLSYVRDRIIYAQKLYCGYEWFRVPVVRRGLIARHNKTARWKRAPWWL